MTLKFGVPNKGRLNERTIELLAKAGIDLGEDVGRRLYVKARNQDIEVLFLRAQDIPEFVATGAIDIGITGQDQVAEAGAQIEQVLELRFGYCHMAVAVPEASGIKDASEIKDGSRIATSYPNIARRYFESLGKDVSVIVVTGAAEIMPYLGISDYIVDLVSTGSTLKMNRMIEAGRILDSQAAVFTSKQSMEKYGEQIEEIASSIQSVIDAENKRYIMADVPRDRLSDVERIIPGIGGPTILDIAGNSGFMAVHAVIDSDQTFHVIAELKKIGAKGILTTPIERLVN
ncbi:MAG: ATP phosphoribosyltransferase [Methanomassiliicoccales archaeon Mx-03]|nr:ATP phosphoribosyltransferase [Methanomassiliicoccaceae archaeon DOK]TQS79654.1 MAG: ATP phosphoribosyltransferase [Methanomassiliicoccales archaeon Mx-03]